MSEPPGSGRADDLYRATYLMENFGLDRRGRSPKPLRRRRPGGRPSPKCAGAAAGHRAARRADQPSRPGNHRAAGGRDQPVEFRRHVCVSHDRRFSSGASAAPLSAGPARRAGSIEASRISGGMAATRCWRKRNATSTSWPGRSCARNTGCAAACDGAAEAQHAQAGDLQDMRQKLRSHCGLKGSGSTSPRADASESGKLVIEAKGIGKRYGDLNVADNFSTCIARCDADRPARAERRRQNDAVEDADRRACAGHRLRSGSAQIWRSPRSTRSARVDPDETLSHFLTDGRGDNLRRQRRGKASSSPT